MANLTFTSFFKQRFNLFTQFLTMDSPFTPVYGNLNLIFISLSLDCVIGVPCCFFFNTLIIIRLPTCLGNPFQEIYPLIRRISLENKLGEHICFARLTRLVTQLTLYNLRNSHIDQCEYLYDR